MTMYVSTRILNSSADTATLPNDGFGAGEYPNWARWINTGTTGTVTSDGAVSPAVGGEYTTKPHAAIDLTAALSNMLGRQVTQGQTFRISYLGVTIENDDAGDNNDECLAATGRFRWYSPQSHRVDAYQAYRKAWRLQNRGGSTGSSMLFSDTDATQGEYKALRCGIAADATEQIPFASIDPFTDITGTYPNLYYIFKAHDDANAGDGTQYTNKLWQDGRTGHPQGISWTASNINTGGNGDKGDNRGYQQPELDIEAMCGLLHFVLDSTQSDDLFSFDDEYHLRVTIGIDGWGGEF
jgi:hypothetical protein